MALFEGVRGMVQYGNSLSVASGMWRVVCGAWDVVFGVWYVASGIPQPSQRGLGIPQR